MKKENLDLLKDCGKLLKLGLSSPNITTQINQDPRAVNLVVLLPDEESLKIVQSIQKVLGGKCVYTTSADEYKKSKTILESIDVETNRLLPPVGNVCEFCQESISSDQADVIHHMR